MKEEKPAKRCELCRHELGAHNDKGTCTLCEILVRVESVCYPKKMLGRS